MRQVSASEFARNFGQYRELVQREPIAVTSHGRPTGYFVSAAEFEEWQRHKGQMRQSFSAADLPPEKVEAIATTRMGPGHNHLNALMDEE